MRPSRRVATAVSVVMLGAAPVVLFASPAGAGGGCHRQETGQTAGEGTTVELKLNCMEPTVLHATSGATIEFVNRDSFEHNLFGIGWFDESMAPGEVFSRRFDGDGVYPFACHIHPGMVGAVVVGDGQGAAASSPVIAESEPAPPAERAAVTSPVDDSEDGNGSTAGLVLAAAGVGALAGAGLVARRHRRSRVAAAS